MAFRIFKPKKYHLGMTGDEVKEALQGGGSKLQYEVINITYNESNQIVFDKSYNEILEIASSGKIIFFKLYDALTRSASLISGELHVYFDNTSFNSNDEEIAFFRTEILLFSDNTTDMDEYEAVVTARYIS